MSTEPELTDEAVSEIEEIFALDREAWRLLDLVVAEWESDPQSVACFDLRVVERAKRAVARRRELDGSGFLPRLF